MASSMLVICVFSIFCIVGHLPTSLAGLTIEAGVTGGVEEPMVSQPGVLEDPEYVPQTEEVTLNEAKAEVGDNSRLLQAAENEQIVDDVKGVEEEMIKVDDVEEAGDVLQLDSVTVNVEGAEVEEKARRLQTGEDEQVVDEKGVVDEMKANEVEGADVASQVEVTSNGEGAVVEGKSRLLRTAEDEQKLDITGVADEMKAYGVRVADVASEVDVEALNDEEAGVVGSS
eukprot:GHVS01056697.1.p1 GENE.GHVS01056697.1~~GHVS01056697.1.p1  ORF type:complete len:228 (-),score=63.49 GHVS01056697.1:79-762(-)